MPELRAKLEAALQALSHRSTAAAPRGVRQVSVSAVILRRLAEALNSNEASRRLGGLSLAVELIDVNEWSRVGTGAARFCRLLRAAIDKASSAEELSLAVRTLGHAVRSAGSAATDATDTELARALDWMAASPDAQGAAAHRVGACMIVTELATRGGPQAASAVAARLHQVTSAVWVALCDERLETRVAAIGTLRACIAIACQRDGGVAAWFEASIGRALDALERHEAYAAYAEEFLSRQSSFPASHSASSGAARRGAPDSGRPAGLRGVNPMASLGGGRLSTSPFGGRRSGDANRCSGDGGGGVRYEAGEGSSTAGGVVTTLDSVRGLRMASAAVESGRHSGAEAAGSVDGSSLASSSRASPPPGATLAEVHGCLLALSELLDVTAAFDISDDGYSSAPSHQLHIANGCDYSSSQRDGAANRQGFEGGLGSSSPSSCARRRQPPSLFGALFALCGFAGEGPSWSPNSSSSPGFRPARWGVYSHHQTGAVVASTPPSLLFSSSTHSPVCCNSGGAGSASTSPLPTPGLPRMRFRWRVGADAPSADVANLTVIRVAGSPTRSCGAARGRPPTSRQTVAGTGGGVVSAAAADGRAVLAALAELAEGPVVSERRRGFTLVWRLRDSDCIHVREAVLQVLPISL